MSQLFVAVMLLTAGAVIEGQVAPSARELEAKALAYRRSLHRGHLVVRVRYLHDPNFPGNEKIVRDYDVRFDQDKLRSVVRFHHPKWEKTTRAIITDSFSVSDWWDQSPVVMSGSRRLEFGAENAFDPRLLGLHTTNLGQLTRFNLSEPLWFFGRQETRVVSEKVEDELMWRVDYQTTPTQRVRLWVAPRFGYGVVRIEVENDDLHNMGSIASEYHQFSNRWFPRRVVYRTYAGGKLRLEEVAEVKSAEFDLAIDPEMFRLEKLGLAAGREVVGPDHKSLIWTGEGLAPRFGAH